MLTWPTHSFKNFGHKRNLSPAFFHSSTTPHPRIASTENFSKTAFHSWALLSVCCLVIAVSLSSYISSLPIQFFPQKFSTHSLYPNPVITRRFLDKNFPGARYSAYTNFNCRSSSLLLTHSRKFTSPIPFVFTLVRNFSDSSTKMPGTSYGDEDCLYFSGETLSGKTSFLKKKNHYPSS